MRTSLLALAAVTVSVAIAACGGGGGGANPAPVGPAAGSVTAPNPAPSVNNTSGAMAMMTITLTLPNTKAATAAVQAALTRQGSAQIRSLANTSPSAELRATGQQQTGRQPQFVSGATRQVELVMSNGSAVLTDGLQPCTPSAGQCQTSFSVPVASGMTASLLLYDSSLHLLGAGSTSNVTVVSGTNQPLPITVNGVVAYLSVANSAAQPFIADPSQAQSGFTVGVTPLDADFNILSTPGTIVDATFKPVTGVSVVPVARVSFSTPAPTDVTPTAPTVLALNPNNTFATATYNYGGTSASEYAIEWRATVQSGGSPVIPVSPIYNFYGTGTGPPPTTGVYSAVITPVLQWTNPNSYPRAGFNNPADPSFAYDSVMFAQFNTDFPTLAGQTASFGLQENVPYSGSITLQDNSGCISSYVGYTNPATGPSPSPYTSLNAPPYVQLTVLGNGGPIGNCVLTAVDDNGHQAYLNISLESSSLTIQNKARKK